MEDKRKYYNLMVEEMKKIKASGERPSLLMHVCCGPCSTFPIEFLADVFDLTLHFNNSNIYPSQEYYRRLEELKKYLDIFNQCRDYPVNIIVTNYDNENYNKILEKGKDDLEGGPRCHLCYETRMKEALDYASKHNFNYFTTVMTISRQKSSEVLNKIGEKLIKDYPNIKYFYSDFKKNKGINRKEELVNLYQMYRQQYCGCIYSYVGYKKRIEAK